MKTLVFLLLVLPPSWSTQRLGQKDSDLDAELELEDGGVHSHEDPYTSAARVKTSDDVDKGYIPLCYTEPTDSKYTLECANGEFAQRWNGCIELGSQRVRCPKYHYPCNNIRPNGKEFYCSVTSCKGDTFGGKRTDCIEAKVLPGGFTDLEVNDEKALEAAAAAVSTLARVIGASNPVSPCGKNISLVGVEKASSQVVAGTKYALTLRLATHTGDDCATRVEKVCQKISVWEKLPFMCPGDRPCHELVQQENIECTQSLDGQEGTESEDNAGKRLKRASPQGEYTDPVIGCIKGLNNIIVHGITLSQCKSTCSAATSFACNSMDYSPKKRKCHLSTETKRSKPDDYYEPCYTDPNGSLYLERKDGCEMYEDCYYGGRMLRILEGDHVHNLSPFFFNDKASSFRLNSGCRLNVWKHSNYKGRAAHIDRNLRCVEKSWNNVISSVICKCS